jgi:hypothetical protein
MGVYRNGWHRADCRQNRIDPGVRVRESAGFRGAGAARPDRMATVEQGDADRRKTARRSGTRLGGLGGRSGAWRAEDDGRCSRPRGDSGQRGLPVLAGSVGEREGLECDIVCVSGRGRGGGLPRRRRCVPTPRSFARAPGPTGLVALFPSGVGDRVCRVSDRLSGDVNVVTATGGRRREGTGQQQNERHDCAAQPGDRGSVIHHVGPPQTYQPVFHTRGVEARRLL